MFRADARKPSRGSNKTFGLEPIGVIESHCRSTLVIGQREVTAQKLDQRDMGRIGTLKRHSQNALVALGASLGAAASAFATSFVAREPNKCFEPTLGNPRAAQTKRWAEV